MTPRAFVPIPPVSYSTIFPLPINKQIYLLWTDIKCMPNSLSIETGVNCIKSTHMTIFSPLNCCQAAISYEFLGNMSTEKWFKKKNRNVVVFVIEGAIIMFFLLKRGVSSLGIHCLVPLPLKPSPSLTLPSHYHSIYYFPLFFHDWYTRNSNQW